MSTQRYLAEATGRISDILSADSLAGELQDLSYDWDLLGNLESREDQSGSKDLYESFQYDGLNRLRFYTTENRITYALNTQEVQYDGLGNIRYKSNVGTYGYNYAGKPHAVSNAGGVAYGYDANGNNTSSTAAASPVIVQARSLAYTSFNQAKLISQGTHTTRFYYGPDRARYKRTDNDAGGTVTTLYLGSVEKLIQPGGNYQFKRYIGGVAILSQGYTSGHVPSGASGQTLVLRDHLGSVDVLLAWHADGSVAVAQELSFDAWGQRRYASDWFTLTPAEVYSLAPAHNALTTRGFTNHEMVDEVGIIHMNGRIYDPRLGRFLQANPFIQDAADVQMYNRYSYTRNNPLNTTDPSGYFLDELFTAIKIVAAVVLTFACQGVCGPAVWAWTMGTIAAVQTAATGGSFGDIAMAAFTSVAMAHAGAQFALGGFSPPEVISFGVLGGITNVLQGGKFGHGFISAGVGAALGNVVRAGTKLGDALKSVGRTIVRSVVGGTLSEITGGKFANGAAFAAFASILQEGAMAAAYEESGEPPDITDDVNENLWIKSKMQITEDGKMSLHLSADWSPSVKEGQVIDYIADIEKYWNSSVIYEGKVYSLTLTIDRIGVAFPGRYSGDVTFRASFECEGCNWEPTTLAIAKGHYIHIRQFRPGIAAHEFGHVLGLGHQANSTQSIMSYNPSGIVQRHDLYRLYQAYR